MSNSPGCASSRCWATAVAEARCPPPVSAMRNSRGMGIDGSLSETAPIFGRPRPLHASTWAPGRVAVSRDSATEPDGQGAGGGVELGEGQRAGTVRVGDERLVVAVGVCSHVGDLPAACRYRDGVEVWGSRGGGKRADVAAVEAVPDQGRS